MPLSPLIFVLSMESLATRIRNSLGISGILVGDQIHKVNMLADDILLTIADPETLVLNFLLEPEANKAVSGFKINYSKSEALEMPLDNPVQDKWLKRSSLH